MITFADDVTLVLSDKSRLSNQIKLNWNLAKLETFLSNNELAINTSKTSLLELMIKQKKGRTGGEPPHLIVENKEKPGEMLRISDALNFRILGSNLQQNMNWRAHLETGKKAVLTSIRKHLGSLKQLGNQLPMHSKKLLAEGLLLSKFTYLITQWGGVSENYLTSAQRLQNQIARWVSGLPRRTRVSKLIETCGWLSISEMARYHCVVQIWKVVRLKRPLLFSEKLTMTDDNKIETSRSRLQFTSEGFRWRSTDQWNQLPTDIRTIRSLPSFKRRVNTWILSQRLADPD